MQRRVEVRGVEQAQAQELERTAAERTAEDAGHLVVEFDRKHQVQRRELLLGHARARLAKQFRRDARLLQVTCDDVGTRAGVRQEAVDEGDRDSGADQMRERDGRAPRSTHDTVAGWNIERAGVASLIPALASIPPTATGARNQPRHSAPYFKHAPGAVVV